MEKNYKEVDDLTKKLHTDEEAIKTRREDLKKKREELAKAAETKRKNEVKKELQKVEKEKTALEQSVTKAREVKCYCWYHLFIKRMIDIDSSSCLSSI